MKRMYLKFYKDVSYWNTHEGMGVKADGTRDDSRWGVDVSFMNGYIDLDDGKDFQQKLVDYINDKLACKITADYLTVMDDGRISFTLIEDKDGDQIDDEDNFQGQMYICDYDIIVEVHEVHTPNAQYLANILPQADKCF